MNPLSTFWTQAKERKRELAWMGVSWLAVSVALALGIWFCAYRISTQMAMETWASCAGKLQARVWFQEGRYRLLELSSDDKSRFTGRTEGPFEIWTWTHYTNAPLLTVTTDDHRRGVRSAHFHYFRLPPPERGTNFFHNGSQAEL